jgi:hypothetical protein
MESEAPYARFATLVPQPGGWVFVRFIGTEFAPYPPVAMIAKTAERDGRRVITTLIVVAERVSSTVIKALPIGRIESLLNTPTIRDQIEAAGDRHETLDAFLEAEIGWEANTPTFTRRIKYGPGQRAAPPREPLRRPDRSDPEGFYRRVADAYNETLATTSAPAPVLAAEAGVPVPTARRWIAEARRRGLLPPGRQGRAG